MPGREAAAIALNERFEEPVNKGAAAFEGQVRHIGLDVANKKPAA